MFKLTAPEFSHLDGNIKQGDLILIYGQRFGYKTTTAVKLAADIATNNYIDEDSSCKHKTMIISHRNPMYDMYDYVSGIISGEYPLFADTIDFRSWGLDKRRALTFINNAIPEMDNIKTVVIEDIDSYLDQKILIELIKKLRSLGQFTIILTGTINGQIPTISFHFSVDKLIQLNIKRVYDDADDVSDIFELSTTGDFNAVLINRCHRNKNAPSETETIIPIAN